MKMQSDIWPVLVAAFWLAAAPLPASESAIVSASKFQNAKPAVKKEVGDLDPAPATESQTKKKDEAKTEEAAKAEEKSEEASDDTDETYNFAKMSGTAAIVSGDKSMFRQRAHVLTDFSGGVENLHLQGDIGENTTFTLDGRGLFDAHDYNLAIDIRRDDLGYINTGYREFRTWYDNTGGFFPKNGQFFDLYEDRVFAIDRGEIWFESGLTLPGIPEIIFRYERLMRDGYKDSTSWGDSNLTGGFGSRGIIPSFWQIDEKRDIFSLEMRDRVEDTSFGTRATYEVMNQDNGLYIRRRAYEPTTDRYITQREGVQSDMFNIHGWQETEFGETEFGEDTRFSTAYGFTTLDTNLSGSRIYGDQFDAPYMPIYTNRQQRDEGFIGLTGGSKLRQHVATLNWASTPCEDTGMTLSLRIENEKIDTISNYQESNIGNPPGLVPSLTRIVGVAAEERLTVAERAEVKFTGIDDWVLYSRADWEEGNGYWNTNEFDADTGANPIFWDSDIERFIQKYTVGSYWYPTKELSTATQYYFRWRETDYGYTADSTLNGQASGDRYPAYIVMQGQLTHDLNMRVTARPCNGVTAITRYDFQINQRYNGVDDLEVVQSGDTRTHIIGETITLTPMNRLYVQGNVNWVYSDTDTQADERTGAAQDLVFDFQNSYWQAGMLTGYALTEETDLQVQYNFYRAYDYLDNSGQSLPYGAGTEEHSVSAGLLWRIAENIRWNLKYGFIKNLDKTSGQHNNFDAHLAYSSVDVAF